MFLKLKPVITVDYRYIQIHIGIEYSLIYLILFVGIGLSSFHELNLIFPVPRI